MQFEIVDCRLSASASVASQITDSSTGRKSQVARAFAQFACVASSSFAGPGTLHSLRLGEQSPPLSIFRTDMPESNVNKE
jgi:hypothetical protein